MAILFHDDSINSGLKNRRRVKSWINKIIAREQRATGNLNFIFTTDEDLLQINIKYLKHNYYTDIISFDYSEGKEISGDVYISVERVMENANTVESDAGDELLRVIVHGVLHLLGYKDYSASEKAQMRIMEDNCLEEFYSID